MSYIAENECSLSRDRIGRIRGKFYCPREKDPFAIVQMLNKKVLERFPSQEIVKVRRSIYPECPNRSWWIVKWDNKDIATRNIKIEITDNEAGENNNESNNIQEAQHG